MNHILWETYQYQLTALPAPQRQQAQAAYCDAWEAVTSKQVTEASALRFLRKQMEQFEREGEEKEWT